MMKVICYNFAKISLKDVHPESHNSVIWKMFTQNVAVQFFTVIS
jgi:hypothetical protein